MDNYDLLETKLKEKGIPYTRIGAQFSTHVIFNDDLQRYAKEFNLVNADVVDDIVHEHNQTIK